MIVRQRGAGHRSNAIEAYARRVRRGMGQDGTDTTYSQFVDPGIAPGDTIINVPTFDTTNPVISTSGGGAVSPGFDWSKLFSGLTGGAVAGAKIFQSLQTPGLVPGTQAIYNPATGQFYNPQTGQVVSPGGTTIPLGAGISSSTLLIGGLLIGGVLLVSMMGKH